MYKVRVVRSIGRWVVVDKNGNRVRAFDWLSEAKQFAAQLNREAAETK